MDKRTAESVLWQLRTDFIDLDRAVHHHCYPASRLKEILGLQDKTDSELWDYIENKFETMKAEISRYEEIVKTAKVN